MRPAWPAEGVAVRLLTGVWALDEAMDTAGGTSIVTGVWALIGIVGCIWRAAHGGEVSLPDQTIEQLKEDKRWMTGQSSWRRDIEQTQELRRDTDVR